MSFQKCCVCNGSGQDPFCGTSDKIPICPTCKGMRIISEQTGLPPEKRNISASDIFIASKELDAVFNHPLSGMIPTGNIAANTGLDTYGAETGKPDNIIHDGKKS